jgi:hypothetical protein
MPRVEPVQGNAPPAESARRQYEAPYVGRAIAHPSGTDEQDPAASIMPPNAKADHRPASASLGSLFRFKLANTIGL